MPQSYTLVYDGNCRMCMRFVDRLRSWDTQGTIEVVPSQAPGVMARFPWIAEAAYADAMQLIGPAQKTWAGAAAVEQLLAILPRGRWISWIFRIPHARALADKVYRWVARNRYRMGCSDHCRAPSTAPDARR